MESRPEQRVVRRMMWDAAAFGHPGAGEPERDAPVVVPPGVAAPEAVAPEPSSRRGPGSQIRRYVHRPLPTSPAKRPAPSPSEPIKPRD